MQRMIFTWQGCFTETLSVEHLTLWWESGWFLLSFLLIMLSFLLLCAKYSSNAVMTVISIFTVVLLYYLNFLCMSNTWPLFLLVPKRILWGGKSGWGLLSLILIKRWRLRELVIGQGWEVTESAPELRPSEFKSSSFSVMGVLSAGLS